jgi:hypothetical protein
LLQLIFSTVFSFSWSEQALSPGQVVSLSTFFLVLVQVLCFGHRISAHASVFGVFLGPRLVLLFGHATPAHRLLFIFFVRLDLSLVSPLCRGEPLYSAAQSEFYRRPISVLVDFSLPVRALSPVLRVAVLAARARAAELFRFPAQLRVPIACRRRYFSSRSKFRSGFTSAPESRSARPRFVYRWPSCFLF